MSRLFILIILFAMPVTAGGLQASFTSSDFRCPTDDSALVFCFTGETDNSGNLIDRSENLTLGSEDMDSVGPWSHLGVTVTADQYRDPYGNLTAELVDNSVNNNGVLRQDVETNASIAGQKFTWSVSVRSDYNHLVTINMYDVTAVAYIAEQTFMATRFWQRISVTGYGITPASTDVRCGILPGERGVSTGLAYFADANFQVNNEYRTNRGTYLRTTTTVEKPNHDLDPSDPAPTRALADLEYQGRRLPARAYNGTNQYYSKAHHDSMNVNDTDHTYTFYISSDINAAGDDYIFTHGANNADGLIIFADTARYRAIYSSGGSRVDVRSQNVATNDGMFNILQIVRSSNTATFYLNGVAGTPLDVTGEGIDGNRLLYLGVYDGGGSLWFEGRISFSKLTARALSLDELAQEREKIWAMATNSWGAYAAWDIVRSTIAHKTFTSGGAHAINNYMTEVAANIPRVDYGLLVEGQSTNEIDYSETFNNWNTARISVVANSVIAPDGSLTADTLQEDGTVASSHFISLSNIIPVAVGEIFTYSIYLAPANREWGYIQIFDAAAGINLSGYFNVSEGRIGNLSGDVDYSKMEPAGDGWWRCSIGGAMDGTAVTIDTVYVYPAEANNDITFDGLNQASLYAWGAQFEESPFPTSYIEVPGTDDVTRTADDITMSPCDDVQSCKLPLGFGGAGQADKLTVYFEARCQWSEQADMIVNHRILEISGNGLPNTATRNRLSIYGSTLGRIFALFRDDADADHIANTAIDAVPYDEWFELRFVIDFSDLSRMAFYLNESETGVGYTGNTGAADFDLSNAKIRVGQDFSGAVDGNCKIKNLRINNKYIQAP